MSEYIDLALPSKTLWAKQNENQLFLFEDATARFGESLPTKEQVQELIDECKWTFDEKKNGFTVVGKNGNAIFLPLRDCNFGFYHSRSIVDEKHYYGWSVDQIHKGELFVALMYRSMFFVRLVLKKDDL